MESYLGSHRGYYPQGLPTTSGEGSTPTTYSSSPSPSHYQLYHGNPPQHPQSPSVVPSQSTMSVSRKAANQYSGDLPYPHLNPRQFNSPPGSSQQTRQTSDPYLARHNSLQHAAPYVPPHSRPPDVQAYNSRSSGTRCLEVTRVGPAHTFSSISPIESSQIITSRPNMAHSAVTNSLGTDYRLNDPRYLDQHRSSSYAVSSSSRSSSSHLGRGHGSKTGNQHIPTLIKAEEPTTLSAAHSQLQRNIQLPHSKDKRFETATAPVPYAVAKRAEDPYFNDKLEESYACIKKVENPYAINNMAASSSRSSTGEVKIKRQRNDAYSGVKHQQFINTYSNEFSQLNGSSENWLTNSGIAPESSKKGEKYAESKSDLVLDLSVKTVRQTADSTAPEPEALASTSSTPSIQSIYGNASIPSSSNISSYVFPLSKENVAGSYKLDNKEAEFVRCPDAKSIAPNFNKFLAQESNGLPSTSLYSPNVSSKRPSDSPSNLTSKMSKLDSQFAHTQQQYASNAGRLLGPNIGLEAYSSAVKIETAYMQYPGMADKTPTDSRASSEAFKAWNSYYDKSKSQFAQSAYIKQEKCLQQNSGLPDFAPEVTLCSKYYQPDVRCLYQNVNQAVNATSNYPLHPSHYYPYPNQSAGSQLQYPGSSEKEKQTVPGYYSSYGSYSTGSQESTPDVDYTKHNKEETARSMEPFREIRVKTESEINSSCLPPTSVPYSCSSYITAKDSAKYYPAVSTLAKTQGFEKISTNSASALVPSSQNMQDSANIHTLPNPRDRNVYAVPSSFDSYSNQYSIRQSTVPTNNSTEPVGLNTKSEKSPKYDDQSREKFKSVSESSPYQQTNFNASHESFTVSNFSNHSGPAKEISSKTLGNLTDDKKNLKKTDVITETNFKLKEDLSNAKLCLSTSKEPATESQNQSIESRNRLGLSAKSKLSYHSYHSLSVEQYALKLSEYCLTPGTPGSDAKQITPKIENMLNEKSVETSERITQLTDKKVDKPESLVSTKTELVLSVNKTFSEDNAPNLNPDSSTLFSEFTDNVSSSVFKKISKSNSPVCSSPNSSPNLIIDNNSSVEVVSLKMALNSSRNLQLLPVVGNSVSVVDETSINKVVSSANECSSLDIYSKTGKSSIEQNELKKPSSELNPRSTKKILDGVAKKTNYDDSKLIHCDLQNPSAANASFEQASSEHTSNIFQNSIMQSSQDIPDCSGMTVDGKASQEKYSELTQSDEKTISLSNNKSVEQFCLKTEEQAVIGKSRLIIMETDNLELSPTPIIENSDINLLRNQCNEGKENFKCDEAIDKTFGFNIQSSLTQNKLLDEICNVNTVDTTSELSANSKLENEDNGINTIKLGLKSESSAADKIDIQDKCRTDDKLVIPLANTTDDINESMNKIHESEKSEITYDSVSNVETEKCLNKDDVSGENMVVKAVESTQEDIGKLEMTCQNLTVNKDGIIRANCSVDVGLKGKEIKNKNDFNDCHDSKDVKSTNRNMHNLNLVVGNDAMDKANEQKVNSDDFKINAKNEIFAKASVDNKGIKKDDPSHKEDLAVVTVENKSAQFQLKDGLIQNSLDNIAKSVEETVNNYLNLEMDKNKFPNKSENEKVVEKCEANKVLPIKESDKTLVKDNDTLLKRKVNESESTKGNSKVQSAEENFDECSVANLETKKDCLPNTEFGIRNEYAASDKESDIKIEGKTVEPLLLNSVTVLKGNKVKEFQYFKDDSLKYSANIIKQRLLGPNGVDREFETEEKSESALASKNVVDIKISSEGIIPKNTFKTDESICTKLSKTEQRLLIGLEFGNKKHFNDNEEIAKDLSLVPNTNLVELHDGNPFDFSKTNSSLLRKDKKSDNIKFPSKVACAKLPINSFQSPWQSAIPYSIPQNMPSDIPMSQYSKQSSSATLLENNYPNRSVQDRQMGTKNGQSTYISSIVHQNKVDTSAKSHLPPPHTHIDPYLASRSPFAARPHSVPVLSGNINPPPPHSAPPHSAHSGKTVSQISHPLAMTAPSNELSKLTHSSYYPPLDSHAYKHPSLSSQATVHSSAVPSTYSPALTITTVSPSEHYDVTQSSRSIRSPHSPTHPPPPNNSHSYSQIMYSQSYQPPMTTNDQSQYNYMTTKPTYTQSNVYRPMSPPYSSSSVNTAALSSITHSNSHPIYSDGNATHVSSGENLSTKASNQYPNFQSNYPNQLENSYHSSYKYPTYPHLSKDNAATYPPISKAGTYLHSIHPQSSKSQLVYTSSYPNHQSEQHSYPIASSGHYPLHGYSAALSHTTHTTTAAKSNSHSVSYSPYPPSTSQQSVSHHLTSPTTAHSLSTMTSQPSSSNPYSNTSYTSYDYPLAHLHRQSEVEFSNYSHIKSNATLANCNVPSSSYSQVSNYESQSIPPLQTTTTSSYSQPSGQPIMHHGYPPSEPHSYPYLTSQHNSQPYSSIQSPHASQSSAVPGYHASTRPLAVSPRGSRASTPHSNSHSPRNLSPHSSRYPSPSSGEFQSVPNNSISSGKEQRLSNHAMTAKDILPYSDQSVYVPKELQQPTNLSYKSAALHDNSNPQVYGNPLVIKTNSLTRKSPIQQPPLNLSSHASFPENDKNQPKASSSPFPIPNQPCFSPKTSPSSRISQVTSSASLLPVSNLKQLQSLHPNSHLPSHTSSDTLCTPTQSSIPQAHSKEKLDTSKLKDCSSFYQGQNAIKSYSYNVNQNQQSLKQELPPYRSSPSIPYSRLPVPSHTSQRQHPPHTSQHQLPPPTNEHRLPPRTSQHKLLPPTSQHQPPPPRTSQHQPLPRPSQQPSHPSQHQPPLHTSQHQPPLHTNQHQPPLHTNQHQHPPHTSQHQHPPHTSQHQHPPYTSQHQHPLHTSQHQPPHPSQLQLPPPKGQNNASLHPYPSPSPSRHPVPNAHHQYGSTPLYNVPRPISAQSNSSPYSNFSASKQAHQANYGSQYPTSATQSSSQYPSQHLNKSTLSPSHTSAQHYAKPPTSNVGYSSATQLVAKSQTPVSNYSSPHYGPYVMNSGNPLNSNYDNACPNYSSQLPGQNFAPLPSTTEYRPSEKHSLQPSSANQYPNPILPAHSNYSKASHPVTKTSFPSNGPLASTLTYTHPPTSSKSHTVNNKPAMQEQHPTFYHSNQPSGYSNESTVHSQQHVSYSRYPSTHDKEHKIRYPTPTSHSSLIGPSFNLQADIAPHAIPKPAHSNNIQTHYNYNHQEKFGAANSHEMSVSIKLKNIPSVISNSIEIKKEVVPLHSTQIRTIKQALLIDNLSTNSNMENNQVNVSLRPLEPGKAALVEKLQKKMGRRDPFDFENINIDSTRFEDDQIDDLDLKISKLMEDLESHRDTVTSKKSCILSKRYLQKVQLQNAADNNEEMVPIPYTEDDESESEREEPIKKFRGKFRSIKDKTVERVILTYASHSDESATEMIPDDDASDFEEELIKEIEAKARKGRSKVKSGRLREVRKKFSSDERMQTKSKRMSDIDKKTRGSARKQDKEFRLSSSEDMSSSSSRDSRESSSSDDSNSDSALESASASEEEKQNNKKKIGMQERADENESDSSDSEGNFKSSRKTSEFSSEEDVFVPRTSKRTRRAKPHSKKSSANGSQSLTKGIKRKNEESECSKRRILMRKQGDLESDSDESIRARTKNFKIGKRRRQVTSSESESELIGKNEIKHNLGIENITELDSDFENVNKSILPIVPIVDNEKIELDLEGKGKNEKPNISEAIDIVDDYENTVDVDQDNICDPDSVIVKLMEERQKELNREDVIEMKLWQQKASLEMDKLLNDIPETRTRHTWKKPNFVDEFKRGWQEEVKRYKTESARIPKRLISTPPPPSIAPAPQGQDKGGSPNPKKLKDGKRAGKGRGNESLSPAKNTRSKSGIIKTSMAMAEKNSFKVTARPEISSFMQSFFEKVMGDSVIHEAKKFQPFAPFTHTRTRTPTGLTPTPSVALSMMASDDSDRDSLASLRTDFPASDSVPVARRSSIANSLIKKLKKKYAIKVDTQWLNKSRSLLEATNEPQLLPTPGLSTVSNHLSSTPYDSFKMKTFFRKDSVNRYRENFEQVLSNSGINELTPVIVPSRTRNKAKAILDAATLKSVFGEEVPKLESSKERDKSKKKVSPNLYKKKKEPIVTLVNRDSPIPSLSLSSTPTEYLYNDDYDSELRSERSESTLRELAIMQDIKKSGRKLRKYRKFRSGFDYIRKKKKVKTEEESSVQTAKRKMPARKRVLWPEQSRDVANEIRSWVINKGLGETVLHKAARLVYHDVVIYCLESGDFNINTKDNAGYTPLHEACNRGHLDIAQALCAHGAHVNAAGYGGMRPLHEAIENGHIELARLLLAYGADPSLATYGGQSCLALASDPQAEKFLKDYTADVKGKPTQKWFISGPASIFDSLEQGINIFNNIPKDNIHKKAKETVENGIVDPCNNNNSNNNANELCMIKSEPQDNLAEDEISFAEKDYEGTEIVFESCERMLPNIYDISGRPDCYVLLRELLETLAFTKNELIIEAGNIETLQLSFEEFQRKAKCKVIGYEMSFSRNHTDKVVMVKYTSQVQKLFEIEYTCVQ